MVYVPRSAEEMNKLAVLVRNAVGYDPSRNDQVEVSNIAFDLTHTQRLQQEVESADHWVTVRTIVLYGSIGVACVLLFLVLRSMFVKLTPLPRKELVEHFEPELESLRIPMETQLRVQKQRLVSDLSKEKPGDIARLIHSWIIEGE